MRCWNARAAGSGIIATEGFRDILEIGRQMRREMYEVRLDPQTPVFLAPREMRLGVRERIGAKGDVVTPLDEDSVIAALDQLATSGAECIAVCLLFSFLNPMHERRVREVARARYPDVEVSLSSEVDPAFREYERTAITAFDAYIKPVVRRYLAALADRLTEAGIAAPLQVMQSRGGLASAGTAPKSTRPPVPVRSRRRGHRRSGGGSGGRRPGPHHSRRRRHELGHRAGIRRQSAAARRRGYRGIPAKGADG